ncbi:MAG: hypothetical protein IJV22_07075 [Bacteroidales bacterium]|nr:hypothetical protein [Bacteroidales bacterium]
MPRTKSVRRTINATTGVSRMYQTSSVASGTHYGCNPGNGQFSNQLRASGRSTVGRGGQTVSRRQRYYDLRVSMGLSGG